MILEDAIATMHLNLIVNVFIMENIEDQWLSIRYNVSNVECVASKTPRKSIKMRGWANNSQKQKTSRM